MLSHKLSALFVAAVLATSAPLHAQTAPAGAAGAGAATGAAAGTISAGVVFGTVAGLAVISALTSGSSGSAVNVAAATQSAGTAATSANVASAQTLAVATNVKIAIDELAKAAGGLATSNIAVKDAIASAHNKDVPSARHREHHASTALSRSDKDRHSAKHLHA